MATPQLGGQSRPGNEYFVPINDPTAYENNWQAEGTVGLPGGAGRITYSGGAPYFDAERGGWVFPNVIGEGPPLQDSGFGGLTGIGPLDKLMGRASEFATDVGDKYGPPLTLAALAAMTAAAGGSALDYGDIYSGIGSTVAAPTTVGADSWMYGNNIDYAAARAAGTQVAGDVGAGGLGSLSGSGALPGTEAAANLTADPLGSLIQQNATNWGATVAPSVGAGTLAALAAAPAASAVSGPGSPGPVGAGGITAPQLAAGASVAGAAAALDKNGQPFDPLGPVDQTVATTGPNPLGDAAGDQSIAGGGFPTDADASQVAGMPNINEVPTQYRLPLSRVLSGQGNLDDYLALAGSGIPSVLGMLAANKQTDALTGLSKDQAAAENARYQDLVSRESARYGDIKAREDARLAQQRSDIEAAKAVGAPYRSRLSDLYANPSGFLSSPEVQVPTQQSTDAVMRALSTGGNPYGNPGALLEAQNYTADKLFGRLGEEKNRLATLGGIPAYGTAGATIPGIGTNLPTTATAGSGVGTQAGSGAATGAIGADAGFFNALGYGAEQLFAPQDNTLAALLKKIQGNSGNIFRTA